MSFESKILDRIKELCGLNNVGLAAFFGETPQNISNWYNRNRVDYRKIIEKFNGDDLMYILTGEGKPSSASSTCVYGKDEQGAAGMVADASAVYKPSGRNMPGILAEFIPVYELSVGTSFSSLVSDPKRHKPLGYLSLPGLSLCDGAISVRGDSMLPALRSGDIVVYKRTDDPENSILWGELYLIVFELGGQEHTVLRSIQKGSDQSSICLENRAHSSQEIPLGSIRALARVMASIRYDAMG